MTSQKCPNCHLVNFASDENCKRCGIDLNQSPIEEAINQPPIEQYKQPELQTQQMSFSEQTPKNTRTADIICAVLWLLLLPILAFDFLFLSAALASANGAPQEAAGAAMALGYAVIPYCAIRAITSAIRSFVGK